MKGYIEDGAYASCTNDLAGIPRQLKVVSDYKAGHFPIIDLNTVGRLLTRRDIVVQEKFQCKLIAKQWGGLLALIGGMALGAACILSGPVGWIALGALVAVAIGTAVALTYHECTDPLKVGSWEHYHSTVKIGREGEKSEAVLYNKSFILCSNCGIIVASETEAIANGVSDDMKWNARGELGLQILSQAVCGFAQGALIGYNIKQGGESKLDLLSPLTTIAEYWYSDFEHFDYSAKESMKLSVAFTVAPYLLGLTGSSNPVIKALGNELELPDILASAVSFIADNGSNFLEEGLAYDNGGYNEGTEKKSGLAFQHFDQDTNSEGINILSEQ